MTTQTIFDKGAIALSVVCAVHCLALPVLAVMTPAIMGYFITDESFHRWLAFVVIPFSLIALTMGCRHHKNFTVAMLGVSGLLVLVFAAAFGHDLLGETGEKVATLFGAGLIAIAHYRNYRLCQQQRSCDCVD